MNRYLIALFLCLSACGKSRGDACSLNGLAGVIGSDGSSCMTCPGGGSPSTTGGAGCSAEVNGVACCVVTNATVTTTTGNGTVMGCWPPTGCGTLWQNECDLLCYTSNTGGVACSTHRQCY